MANWLEKLLLPAPQRQANRNLPAPVKQNRPLTSAGGPQAGGLPNASIVYGGAASALFVIALYFALIGRWVTGGLVLLLAGCFLGYALHFLKYPR
jgi:hypothetical protein